jgi:hypothetical protein
MFVRTVSLILIAAVVACPMWCSNGLCHAGQCCSAEQSAHRACPVHGATRCCCNKHSSDSHDEFPCDAPCESSCQGVCGGAVFEKPIELNDEIDSFLLPFLTAEILPACRLAECRTQNGDHFYDYGGNHGRILRTLYMSFLY